MVGLEVKRGERVVICGPSGSGNSTLTRGLNGLEFHDSSTVEDLPNFAPASIGAGK
ncbi:MAG: ATP-binding cassette domain-containing protein [Litoreibacter sp.]